MILYKITNSINDKVYFGITKTTLAKRWSQHKCNANKQKKKMHLYLAMNKYGIENFAIEELKRYSNEQEMYEDEKLHILNYKSNNREYGYNNSIGGEVSTLGMKHSEETKRKISEIQKVVKKTNSGTFKKGHIRVITEERLLELREKFRLMYTGREVSEETKQKIKEKRKFQVISHSKETREKISKSHKGKSFSDEHRAKIRESKLGNKNRLGKKHSEETKLKISNSKRGVKNNKTTE